MRDGLLEEYWGIQLRERAIYIRLTFSIYSPSYYGFVRQGVRL